MAYRAEIEIGVRGVQELTQLQKRLDGTAYKIDEINKKQVQVFGGLAQSIKNYTTQLQLAEKALFNVAAGTSQETRAVSNYVTALGNANAVRSRQNALIEEEIQLQRKAALASKSIRETTQYSGPIGPGQASSILGGQSAPVAERIDRIIKARNDELQLQTALLKLEERSAEQLNKKVQAQQSLVAGTQEVLKLLERQSGLSQYERPLPIPGGLRTEQVLAARAAKRTESLAIEQRLQRVAASTVTQYNLQLGILRQMAAVGKQIGEATQQEIVNQRRLNRVLRVRQGRELQRRRREATGSAIIGGAFPLLFGQGAGAALGGGLGGAAGGALGGQFGFGLSLVGTAAGQALDNFINNIKTLSESLKDPAQTLTALEQAGFAVDDSVKKTVQQLLEANKVYEAQTVALQQITDTLGPNSVELLNAYNKESKQLNSSYQDLTASITRSLLPALVGAVAAINDLSAGTKNIQVPSNLLKFLSLLSPSQLITSGPVELLAQRGRQAAEEAGRPDAPDNQAAAEATKKARETADQLERQAAMLRDQVRLAEINGDLTDERVFTLRKSIIFQEAALKLAEDGLTTEQRVVIELERKLKLQNLLNERVKEENRAREDAARKVDRATREAERAAREAERVAKEAARAEEQRITQLETSIIGALQAATALRQVRLETLEFERGSLAAVEQKLQTIALERDNEIKILGIKYQQTAASAKSKEEAYNLQEIYLNQRAALIEQYELEHDRTFQKKQQLKVEQKLLKLQTEQANLAVKRDLSRQIADVQRGLAFPFGGEEAERLNLAVDQQRRREDALRAVNQQIKEQTELRNAAAPGERAAFDTRIQGLQDQLELYNRLLPQLDAVEQAQLRQNQLMERYGFIANEVSTAMTSAVQAVVTGTGTVEEAFATMFQNIGRAFIDMATQMLAQKLFMTVLGALGGGITGGGGFSKTGFYDPVTGLGAAGPNFGLADGGTVMPGNTYMVGERGPELLQLNRNGSGQVINNNQLSSAMNRYRRSGSTAMMSPDGTTEAAAGGIAVTEKPIDVRYTVERINNVDYVTAEQFQQGMRQAATQGAQRGEQQTLKRLQMSSSTRRRLGI